MNGDNSDDPVKEALLATGSIPFISRYEGDLPKRFMNLYNTIAEGDTTENIIELIGTFTLEERLSFINSTAGLIHAGIKYPFQASRVIGIVAAYGVDGTKAKIV
jgi:hypothetical protein